MAVQADPYITVSRALITLFLIGGAIFSVNLAYLLFVKGIGQGTDQLSIDIWGVSISPGSIGTAFLAMAIVFVVAAVKSKPVFSYKSQGAGGKGKKSGGGGSSTNIKMAPLKPDV